MTVTTTDAKARRVVRLPDGRTAVLLFVPPRQGSHHRGGAKAKVALHALAIISVPVDQLELVDADAPPAGWVPRWPQLPRLWAHARIADRQVDEEDAQ